MDTSKEVVDFNAEYFKLKSLGNQHFHNDEYDKAKECYLKAIDCNPPLDVLEILHVNLATIYSKAPSDWEAVVRHSNLALEINQEDVRAMFGKYRAHEACERYAEALTEITNICCLRHNDNMYLRMLDTAITRVAEVETEQLIKHRTPNPRTKYNINAYFNTFINDPMALWWRGKIPVGMDSESVLCNLMNQHSMEETAGDMGDTKSNLTGFAAAVWDLRRQNYSNIMDHCTEELANEESKFKAEAHLLRGTFRFFWSFPEAEILADLDLITSGSLPASAEIQTSAWIKRGELYTLFKNIKEMGHSFQKAQTLSPQNPDVDAAYCNSLMESELLLEAYTEISKAVKKAIVNPAHLGIACFLKFRIDAISNQAMAPIDGLTQFESYLAKYPNCSELHIAFAHLFKDIRESCAAYMHFRKACELDPENYGYAVNMVMMKFEAIADVDACVKELNEIIAKDDTTVNAYEALATLFISVGPDFKAAFAAIEKGLKVAKNRHDFQTFAILKKTAEVRQQIMTNYETNDAATCYGRRYDEMMMHTWDSRLD